MNKEKNVEKTIEDYLEAMLMIKEKQGYIRSIDVAYRYFTTESRSFIVADTPGHEEYTRNMAVGASFAELAISENWVNIEALGISSAERPEISWALV